MIPMSCPSCGCRGVVPPDRLNSRLHCKKCDAVFHMDSTGHVVLGEPGAKGGRPPKVPRSREPVEFGLDLTALKRVPRPVAIGGAAVLAAVLWWAFGPTFGEGTPIELLPRAEYAGRAFVDRDDGVLGALATPETATAVEEWFKKARPTFAYDGPSRPGNAVIVTGMVMQETDADAMVLVSLMPPTLDRKGEDRAGAITGYSSSGTFSLPLYWTRKDGRWLLDGGRTLGTIPVATAVAKAL